MRFARLLPSAPEFAHVQPIDPTDESKNVSSLTHSLPALADPRKVLKVTFCRYVPMLGSHSDLKFANFLLKRFCG